MKFSCEKVQQNLELESKSFKHISCIKLFDFKGKLLLLIIILNSAEDGGRSCPDVCKYVQRREGCLWNGVYFGM